MSFTFRCPACISGSLTSNVTVRGYEKEALVSGAFFDVSGILNPPTRQNTITTFCSNGHTVVNVVPNIPKALIENLKYFVENP